MLLVQLALCWTIGLAEDAFEKETYYIHNDEMNRSIYAVQIKPKDLAEGEKVPLIIYVHGGNGTANSYIGLAKTLSEQKIAGLMFECCGGNNGKASAAKSDGADLFPAHYSSRISDLEAVLAFAKTLGYWRIAGSPVLACSITNERLAAAGYFSILNCYESLHSCD